MATQDSLLDGCQIFIDRLRSNQKLAVRMIKKMVQEWSKEGREQTI